MVASFRPNRKFDFILNGKGYMLAREQSLGRSWLRRATDDLPRATFYYDPGRFGHQPDEMDHAEVWEDWSGGFGAAYRENPTDNHITFSRDMDTRFPKQMIHCQQLQLLPNTQYSGSNLNVDYITDVPLPAVAQPPDGAGAVLVFGAGFISNYVPTNLPNTIASAFTLTPEATGQNYIGRAAVYGSYVYIGAASGNHVQRGFDGVTYSLAAQPAMGFMNAGNRMWRRFRRNLVNSVGPGVNPMDTTQWSATLNIGNGQYAVADMAERGDQVYLSMADGLMVGDQSGSFYNVVPEARDLRHPDNGRDLDVYNGGVVFGGMPGMYWFQASNFGGQRGDAYEIGPQGIFSNRSPVRGRFRVVETYGPWLYGGIWTGSESYILAGRPQTTGNSQPQEYTWNVMQRLPNTAKISRLHFDGITNASGRYGVEIPTRMWIATDATFGAQANATSPLYVANVPRVNQNPLTDLSFTPNYNGSARVDLPYTHWQMPGVQKTFRVVEIWADNMMSGFQYADVWATIDGGSRLYLGRAQNSPKDYVYFPGENGTFLSGIACQLSIESYTATQTITPIYRAVVMRGAVRPHPIDIITAIVRIADGMRDREGAPMRSGAQMITELRALADPTQTGLNPVVLQDIAGATQFALVLPSIEEQEAYQEGQLAPEIAATCRMAVLTFTQTTGDVIGAQFGLIPPGRLPMHS